MRACAVAAALALAAVSAGASWSTTGPRIWLAQAGPVIAVGTGFPAGRKVPVTFRSGATRRTVTVTADARGRLHAVLAGTTFHRCKGAEVVAGPAELVVLPCSAEGGKPTLVAGRVGVVRGAAFVPHERVIVTGRVSGRAPVAGAVTAGPGGTFALTLPLRPAACAEVFVRAQGSLGSTATMTLAAPACKPA